MRHKDDRNTPTGAAYLSPHVIKKGMVVIINNRQLLIKIVVCAAVIMSVVPVGACSSKPEPGLPNTRVRDDLLNTIITVTIYDDVEENVFEDIFDKISSIEKAMSANLPDSEISKAAAMAGRSPVVLSDETYYVVKEAFDISVESGGAFNLVIGPLVKLWGINTDSPHVPAQTEIEHVLELLDYNKVIMSDSDKSVYLTAEGMRIDLGAIAKGYAGDAAAAVARNHGVQNAVLDLGGNIVTIGGRPDGAAWRIGIRNPVIGESGYIAVLSIHNKSVVTSGGYERFFESDGHIYHHIFDSKTGYPADPGLLSVTVVSNSSTDADRLSTVAFVLGVKDGMEFLKKYKDTEAIFITTDFEIYMTQGIKDLFMLTDERFRVAS